MDRRKNDCPDLEPELIPRTDPVLLENYLDVLTVFPDAQFVNDDGVYRFRPNLLFKWLGDECIGPVYNDLALAYYQEKFSADEYMDFYQGIGYSISGFLDIWGKEVNAMLNEGRVLRAGGRPEKISINPYEIQRNESA